MRVGAWHIISWWNYPSGCVGWLLISTHKHLTQQHLITAYKHALDVTLPSHEHHDSKGWEQLSAVPQQQPDTMLSLKKVSRTPWTPEFSAKPILFLNHLYLLHFTSKMLTCGEARNCQCKKMECSQTSHSVRVGLHCISQELHKISPEPPGGWQLVGDGCAGGTQLAHLCLFWYVRGQKRRTVIWWHFTKR